MVFKKADFEKNQHTTKNMKNFPGVKELIITVNYFCGVDYISTMVKKTSVAATAERNIIVLHRKTSITVNVQKL